MVDHGEDLLHNTSSFIFGESFLSCDVFKKFTTRTILHADIKEHLILVDFIEFNDIRMIERFHDLKFSEHRVLFVFESALFDDFYSEFFVIDTTFSYS